MTNNTTITMTRKQRIDTLSWVRARLYNLKLESAELLNKWQDMDKEHVLSRILTITMDVARFVGQIDIAFPKGDRSDEGDGLRAEYLPQIRAKAMDIFDDLKTVQSNLDYHKFNGDAEWDQIARMTVVKETAHEHYDSELLALADIMRQKLDAELPADDHYTR